MGKQAFKRMKKIIAILMAILFIVTLTAASASAVDGRGWDRDHGWNQGHGWDRDHGWNQGHGWDRDHGWNQGHGWWWGHGNRWWWGHGNRW